MPSAAETQHRPHERMLELAKKLWDAIHAALPRLPTTARSALTLPVPDVAWAFSLLLSTAWLSAVEPARVRVLIEEMHLDAVLHQLSRIPLNLWGFLAAAQESAQEGAAYLITQLSDELAQQSLFQTLRSGLVVDFGRALILRFPPPGSGRTPLWGGEDEDVTRNLLARVNWSPADIERILSGRPEVAAVEKLLRFEHENPEQYWYDRGYRGEPPGTAPEPYDRYWRMGADDKQASRPARVLRRAQAKTI